MVDGQGVETLTVVIFTQHRLLRPSGLVVPAAHECPLDNRGAERNHSRISD
jgi:hypothetical protein